MNLPPGQNEPQLEGHDVSKVTDLAVARTAREIGRIAAFVDQHRGNDGRMLRVFQQTARPFSAEVCAVLRWKMDYRIDLAHFLNQQVIPPAWKMS